MVLLVEMGWEGTSGPGEFHRIEPGVFLVDVTGPVPRGELFAGASLIGFHPLQ